MLSLDKAGLSTGKSKQLPQIPVGHEGPKAPRLLGNNINEGGSCFISLSCRVFFVIWTWNLDFEHQ